LRPMPTGDKTSHLSDPELTAQIRKLTDGVGVDVALEMTGINSSVNNAIHAVRRGGDVILFGLKSGDAVIQSFDRLIVDGISLHSVIGRRIFETWHITRHLLESRDPNIHDLIWEVILNRGEGTMFDFREYDASSFQKAISTYPKVIIRYGGDLCSPRACPPRSPPRSFSLARAAPARGRRRTWSTTSRAARTPAAGPSRGAPPRW